MPLGSSTQVSERLRRRIVICASLIGALGAAAAAPEEQGAQHFDHKAFLETVRQLRHGADLYPAAIAGMESIGMSIDQARALREPWIFELWAFLPEDALRWSFFLVVVLGAAVLAACLARAPEIGFAVGAYAAVAGVYGDVDAWLLFELWAIPLVLGCCLAWMRGHDGVAAACALGAMLLRETLVLLPIGFLVCAWWRRRSLRPWLISIAAAAVVLALHWRAAAHYLDPEGRSAALLGTGSLEAVANMTSAWFLPVALGVAVWGVGLVLLWRSALRPAVLLAAIPLVGLLVNRTYWGFPAMPLCITAIGGLPTWPTGRAASPAGENDRARQQRQRAEPPPWRRRTDERR